LLEYLEIIAHIMCEIYILSCMLKCYIALSMFIQTTD